MDFLDLLKIFKLLNIYKLFTEDKDVKHGFIKIFHLKLIYNAMTNINNKQS